MWLSSPHPCDLSGTVALLDSILQQLSQLIAESSPGEQSVSEVIIMEAFLNAVTFCWQSEREVQIAIAHLIGDKYLDCLRQLKFVMHVECK